MAYAQIQKIENPNPGAAHGFGQRSVIDGYHIIVARDGHDRADLYKRNVGGAWIYQDDNAYKWGQSMHNNYFTSNLTAVSQGGYIWHKDDFNTTLRYFNPTDFVSTSDFPKSSAISDDLVIFGDYGYNLNRGAVVVFERIGLDTWTANDDYTLLTPDISNENDYFGYSVATNGESIIVGAYGDNQGKGTVYIFQKDADTGLWEQTQKLFASDGESNDRFGESVSASGDYFIAGASLKDSLNGDVNSGAAYVFKYSTGWYEVDRLVGIGEDDYEGNHFGESVYINGDHIIVGSPEARSGRGVADIFYKKRSWGHLTKLVGSDSSVNDNFGTSVSISGRFAAVGSPSYESATTGGAVYLYEDSPVRLRLAQEFEVNSQFVPTKASVYLKRVGKNTSNYWPIYNTVKTVIDATNFSTIDKENNIVIFGDTVSGFTGNGYMILSSDNPSFSDFDMSVINYPIRAITPDTYNLWIRCININTNIFEAEILIDGITFKTIDTLIDNPSDGLEWTWVNTTLVLPDAREHILGIKMKENGSAIDKIYIEADNTTPYTEGPDYSLSPYLTAHMQVYDSLRGEPGISLYIYDYKNSITEIIQDDWYNFDIKVLDNIHGYNEANDFTEDYYLVMSVAGSNTSNFIIWELIDNDEYVAPSSAIKF
jgi:hypothetical protein